jgi:hypothetical protein
MPIVLNWRQTQDLSFLLWHLLVCDLHSPCSPKAQRSGLCVFFLSWVVWCSSLGPFAYTYHAYIYRVFVFGAFSVYLRAINTTFCKFLFLGK